MDREQTKRAIEVMQAYVDGNEVEFRYLGPPSGQWNCARPAWDWKLYDYRVKPKPVEVWSVVKGREILNFPSRADAYSYQATLASTTRVVRLVEVSEEEST